MLEGRCCCGEIRYQTNGTPSSPTVCHCRTCRRASGAPCVAWFTVPSTSFQFIAGTPRRFRSSRHAVRTFCPACGTALTFQSERSPNEIDITTCSLQDPEAVAPKDQTWTASRVSWSATLHALPAHVHSRDE